MCDSCNGIHGVDTGSFEQPVKIALAAGTGYIAADKITENVKFMRDNMQMGEGLKIAGGVALIMYGGSDITTGLGAGVAANGIEGLAGEFIGGSQPAKRRGNPNDKRGLSGLRNGRYKYSPKQQARIKEEMRKRKAAVKNPKGGHSVSY